MAESRRPALAPQCANAALRNQRRISPPSDRMASPPSCRYRLTAGASVQSTVCRQMQRRPGVRPAVHEAMTRNVVARVKAIEIHAHLRKLAVSVIGERPRPLIARSPRAFPRHVEREVSGEAQRLRFDKRSERGDIRTGVLIDQPQRTSLRRSERQAASHNELRPLLTYAA